MPLSKYMAPIKASQQSAMTLSSILIFLFTGLKIKIYFSRLIFLATSMMLGGGILTYIIAWIIIPDRY